MSVEEEWFLLKTKTRQEKRAMENLQRQHIDCYCPEVFVEKIFRGKKSQVIEILFPGYLFVSFRNSRSSIHSVKNTRGVQSFISFGGTPSRVPCGLIQELKEKTKPSTDSISNCSNMLNEFIWKRILHLRKNSNCYNGNTNANTQ